jgi:hypothetical protein
LNKLALARPLLLWLISPVPPYNLEVIMPERNMVDHGNQGLQALERRQDSGGYLAPQHAEGTVARAIEQVSKLPSDPFLWAACGATATSLLLQCLGKQHASLLVGQWVAPLLVFGLYTKIVK